MIGRFILNLCTEESYGPSFCHLSLYLCSLFCQCFCAVYKAGESLYRVLIQPDRTLSFKSHSKFPLQGESQASWILGKQGYICTVLFLDLSFALFLLDLILYLIVLSPGY